MCLVLAMFPPLAVFLVGACSQNTPATEDLETHLQASDIPKKVLKLAVGSDPPRFVSN